MKKYLLVAALVLAPSFAFASTPNDTVRATLVQQLLTEFVSEVNSIQAMQVTIATAVDPTQFSSLSTLLQNQFTSTEVQLDNLLNPSGLSEQTNNNNAQNEPVSGSTPVAPTNPVATSVELLATSPKVMSNFGGQIPKNYPQSGMEVMGGNCAQVFLYPIVWDQNGNIMENYPVFVVNPETNATSTITTNDSSAFYYVPQSINTAETVNYYAGNISGSYSIGVGKSELEENPFSNSEYTTTGQPNVYTSEVTGDTVNISTGRCLNL